MCKVEALTHTPTDYPEDVSGNWDERYRLAEKLDSTPVPLLVEVADLLPPGRALDLACGAGRNALYLAGLGWSVVAVDSSQAALDIVRNRAAAARLAIDIRQGDLEADACAVEPDAYDLICDFFYLQRNLFPRIRAAVRPGGLFTAEIHLRDAQPHRFVLEPGELRQEFASWKILYYSESTRPGHARPTAQIIARRA
ncbi:MAG: SAM-dependent methyltransferase [Terriglobia bacterium]|nr:MAG: SAM-dependent methyltransferase [Terriglobia bacterium]